MCVGWGDTDKEVFPDTEIYNKKNIIKMSPLEKIKYGSPKTEKV